MEDVSALLLPLSKALQSSNIDLLKALGMVQEVKTILNRRRTNSLSYFKELFERAEKICVDLNIRITLPRRPQRSTERSNYPTDSAEDYYR